MAFVSETTDLPRMPTVPAEIFRLPVGFVSPLWGVFTGVALTGVAWWWATQWMRAPFAEGLAARTMETLETAPAKLAAVTEPVVEPVADPVLKTVVEAELPVEAVGGESAPVPPAALVAAEEPAPAPTPRQTPPSAMAPVKPPKRVEPAAVEPSTAPEVLETPVVAETVAPDPALALKGKAEPTPRGPKSKPAGPPKRLT